MPCGLECWDENGNLILDATYRVARVIGEARIDADHPSGTVVDDRFLQGGWVSFQPDNTAGDGYLDHGVRTPRFSISGNTLTWAYPDINGGAQYDTIQIGTLFYGAY